MRFKSLLVVAFFLALFSAWVQGQESQGGSAAVYPFQNSSEPIPNWVIEKAKAHVIGFVGQAYFGQKILLESTQTIMEGSKDGPAKKFFAIFFKYDVPLFQWSPDDVGSGNGVQAPQDWKPEYRFIVRLNESGVVESYNGPQKPFAFSLSLERVLEIAKANGIQQPSSIEVVSQIGSDETSIPGQYAIRVVGGKQDQKPSSKPDFVRVPYLFLDPDAGVVLKSSLEEHWVCPFSDPKRCPQPLTAGTGVEPVFQGSIGNTLPYLAGFLVLVVLLTFGFFWRQKQKK